jgi:type IV secretory pathway VirB2 component (pilin)
MVGGAVIVGVLLVWLASGRAQFTWKISWIIGIFVAICATSLVAGSRLASGIAGGIFELVNAIANLIKSI